MSDFQNSTYAEAKSVSRIKLRDTLKTLKKRFWFGEGKESTANEDRKDGCVPFSEVVDGRFAGEFYTPEAPGRPFGCPPGLKEKGTLSHDSFKKPVTVRQ